MENGGAEPFRSGAFGHRSDDPSSPEAAEGADGASRHRRGARVRGSLVRRTLLVVGCAVLGTAGGTALILALSGRATSQGGVVIQGHSTLLGYQSQGHSTGTEGEAFTISGDASPALYPGTSRSIDLSFTNGTDKAIELPAGAIKITVSSPRPACPASPNFSVVQTLTTSITIPKNATNESLADLDVTSRFWPVISMVTTHVTQDACAGMTVTLHYSTGNGWDGD